MPYLVKITALLIAAAALLRGQPFRPYLRTYFFGAMLCMLAEATCGLLLDLYDVHARLLSDPVRDSLLVAFLVNAVIHPLMAVVFARLSSERPFLLAFGIASALGVLEVWFVRSGYMVYRLWHPALSVVFYFLLFVIVHQVHYGKWRLPVWGHAYAMAWWGVANATTVLHGLLRLWRFAVALRPDPHISSHIASGFHLGLVVLPLAALVSTVPTRWPRLYSVLAGATFLLAVETVMLASGILVHNRWSLWLSALWYVLALGLPALYTEWMFPEREEWREARVR